MMRGALLHVVWLSVAAFAAVATAARHHSERASSQDHARLTVAGKEGKVTRTQGGLTAGGISPVYHDDFEEKDSPGSSIRGPVGRWDVRTTRLRTLMGEDGALSGTHGLWFNTSGLREAITRPIKMAKLNDDSVCTASFGVRSIDSRGDETRFGAQQMFLDLGSELRSRARRIVGRRREGGGSDTAQQAEAAAAVPRAAASDAGYASSLGGPSSSASTSSLHSSSPGHSSASLAASSPPSAPPSATPGILLERASRRAHLAAAISAPDSALPVTREPSGLPVTTTGRPATDTVARFKAGRVAPTAPNMAPPKADEKPDPNSKGADGGDAPDGPSAEDVAKEEKAEDLKDAKAGKLAPLAAEASSGGSGGGSGGGSSDGSSDGSGSAGAAVETGAEGHSDDDGDGSSSSSSGEAPPGVKAAKAAPLSSDAASSGSTETSGSGSDGADVIESDSDDGAKPTEGGGADDKAAKAANAANTVTGPPPGLVKKKAVDASDVFTPGGGPMDDDAWKGKAPIIKAKFSLKGLTVKMLSGPATGVAAKKALQTSLAKALDVPAKTSVRILRLGGASRGDSSAGAVITLAVLVPSKRGASK